MIGYLEGTVLDDGVVSTAGGVGYIVTTLQPLVVGETVQLRTVPLIREDAFELYGFHTRPEADLFRLLTKVSGVGARIAVAIMSDLTPSGTARAIVSEDAKALSRAKGVGPKLAARLAVEVTVSEALLADLLGDDAAPEPAVEVEDNPLLEALAQLELLNDPSELAELAREAQAAHTPETDIGIVLRTAVRLNASRAA